MRADQNLVWHRYLHDAKDIMMKRYTPLQITKQKGFTLLELLIAITVFSILSAIAYGGLKSVLDTEQQTSQYINQLSQYQLGLTLIRKDIEQAVTRSVRDEFGDPIAAMHGGGDSGVFLEFTRGGRPNPMDLQRSGLQRVAYLYEDETLYRITWPVLDRAQATNPFRNQLMDNIKSIDIKYLNQKMNPQEKWPPDTNESAESQLRTLPKAIELTLEVDNWGLIRRLFRVSETPAA